jgi:hypothetical protein
MDWVNAFAAHKPPIPLSPEIAVSEEPPNPLRVADRIAQVDPDGRFDRGFVGGRRWASVEDGFDRI